MGKILPCARVFIALFSSLAMIAFPPELPIQQHAQPQLWLVFPGETAPQSVVV